MESFKSREWFFILNINIDAHIMQIHIIGVMCLAAYSDFK